MKSEEVAQTIVLSRGRFRERQEKQEAHRVGSSSAIAPSIPNRPLADDSHKHNTVFKIVFFPPLTVHRRWL